MTEKEKTKSEMKVDLLLELLRDTAKKLGNGGLIGWQDWDRNAIYKPGAWSGTWYTTPRKIAMQFFEDEAELKTAFDILVSEGSIALEEEVSREKHAERVVRLGVNPNGVVSFNLIWVF